MHSDDMSSAEPECEACREGFEILAPLPDGEIEVLLRALRSAYHEGGPLVDTPDGPARRESDDFYGYFLAVLHDAPSDQPIGDLLGECAVHTASDMLALLRLVGADAADRAVRCAMRVRVLRGDKVLRAPSLSDVVTGIRYPPHTAGL